MSRFELNIHKRLGDARRGFTLQVTLQADARRTVIYGPSGAGKSLTLQAVAGLLRPDHGCIAFGSEVFFDSVQGINRPARERGLGYLFQDYALFPHLNVRQNIAFGLQRGWRNPSRQCGGEAVETWLQRFELKGVAHQYPDELSGGQRQRTALARVLVNEPQALLLDEPFAALDPALRDRLRGELDELLSRLHISLLMISHDPQDLPLFGQQVVQLREGQVVNDGVAVGMDRT